MKPLAKIIIVPLSYCLLALLPFSAKSQKGPDLPTHDWEPTDMINIHDSVAVFKVAYKKKRGEAIAVIDARGNETGEDIPLPENVLGIALHAGHLIAFYQPEKKDEDRELHALALDLRTGKTLEDKVVYSVPSGYYTAFIIERDPNGVFKGFLARVTGYKTKRQEAKENREFSATTGMSLTTLSANLEPHTMLLSTAATQGLYIGSAINGTGDLFVVTSAGQQLVAEKFSPSGVRTGKLATPFDPDEDALLQSLVRLDTSTGNAITAAIHFFRHKVKYRFADVTRFDFSNNKAYAAPETSLDKNYFSSVKLADDQLQKVSRDDRNNLDEFKPVDIVQTGDFVIAVKEIDQVVMNQVKVAGTYSTNVDWYCNTALLSVYDKQMNLLRTIPLFKKLHTAVAFGPAIAIHTDKDKLYAFTVENIPQKGMMHITASFAEYLYTIDAVAGATARVQVRKDQGVKAAITDPRYIFWLKGGKCVVNRIFKMTGMITKVRTSFEAAVYEPAE
jgi:hypothetical protein